MRWGLLLFGVIWFSVSVLVLVEKFGLCGIGNVEDDVKAIQV